MFISVFCLYIFFFYISTAQKQLGMHYVCVKLQLDRRETLCCACQTFTRLIITMFLKGVNWHSATLRGKIKKKLNKNWISLRMLIIYWYKRNSTSIIHKIIESVPFRIFRFLFPFSFLLVLGWSRCLVNFLRTCYVWVHVVSSSIKQQCAFFRFFYKNYYKISVRRFLFVFSF